MNKCSNFDIIILGSIGPVFGDYYDTLSTIKKSMNKNGLIVLDDCYIEDDSDYTHRLIQKREIVLKQIFDVGINLIEEVKIQNDEIKESNDYIFKNLKERCNELIEKYLDNKELFLDYIKQQEDENEVLETKVVCSTILIKKK
ncbi:MAG: hypothetical protein QMD61_03905 [Methanobacterium sp.]|nr:hypothetical protein [Methanobacterium sp.]